MEAMFLQLVNLSMTAGWLVLAVLALRLLLRRAPKSILCAMWGLVGLRLLCPVSIESPLSLVPSAQPLPREILTAAQPEIYSGVAVIDRVVNPVLTNTLAAAPGESVNPAQVLAGVLPWIWLLGMVGMLGYALFTTLRLRRRVSTAVRLEQGVKQSEYVKTPFVLGLIHPTIYLPFHMESADAVHVLAHERAHIRRGDPWWKVLGFVLLAIYWFHPLMWVAYFFLCR
ncbi:MAG TPA: peptidase M56, partial [Candidatus Avoscillospira stercoripullorum]|nr:peptidase M56 [Candidatus Avoscillospira stercoripullorum]